MKIITILALSMLLSACASETYITDVKNESHRKEFQVQTTPHVDATQQSTNSASQVNNLQPCVIPTPVQQNTQQQSQPQPIVVKSVQKKVHITPPKDSAIQRFGYTIQVAAVGRSETVSIFSQRLPQNQQPIWENYKIVNGTKWYTILYGDYATSTEAKTAIRTLPANIRQLKPFVKSIDTIKNSPYPSLNRLN